MKQRLNIKGIMAEDCQKVDIEIPKTLLVRIDKYKTDNNIKSRKKLLLLIIKKFMDDLENAL